MQEFPCQPQHQHRQPQRHHPASGTHERSEDGGNDDGLGNGAPHSGPRTERGEGGKGRAEDVEEEGGDSVVASKGGLEELLFGNGGRRERGGGKEVTV